MVIPEYIIVMTWILIAVVILSIITAILFRLYIMFLFNEKEELRDKAYDIQNQIYFAKNELNDLKEEIKVLKKEKDLWENKK